MDNQRSLRLLIHSGEIFKRLRRCLIKYIFIMMKDWEVRKVNAIYKEVDELKLENTKLREENDRLVSMEQKIDVIIELLDKSKPGSKTKK